MAKIALVTCRPLIEQAGLRHYLTSDLELKDSLAARGFRADLVAWDDISTPWGDYDFILLRSTWNYHRHPGLFLDWLDKMGEERLNVWNPIEALRWNFSKTYLLELERMGIPIVPSRHLPVFDPSAIERVSAEMGWERYVVKPAVSASGEQVQLFDRGGPIQAGAPVESPSGSVLVQPFISEIQCGGEISLVFLEGRFSHAVLKTPAAGEFRVHREYGGSVRAWDPPAWVVEKARRALACVPAPTVYARIDAVVVDKGLLLMELELIEPDLFLRFSAEGSERFVDCIANRAAHA